MGFAGEKEVFVAIMLFGKNNFHNLAA